MGAQDGRMSNVQINISAACACVRVEKFRKLSTWNELSTHGSPNNCTLSKELQIGKYYTSVLES